MHSPLSETLPGKVGMGGQAEAEGHKDTNNCLRLLQSVPFIWGHLPL